MMKTLTALTTAGVIAAAAVAAPAPAQAGHHSGAIVGAAVGGLAVGALIGSHYRPYYGYGYAAPAPVYYGGPYAYSRCQIVRQKVWTNHGPVWRRARVCG